MDRQHGTVKLPSGEAVPRLGQGTWYMGDDGGAREQEIRTLRTGLDLGLTLIDTAEMYGDGRAEELVGEAIAGRRDEVFLVSKVLPSNASARGTSQALAASLKRLRTDYLDLYLLHWRGGIPLAESIGALQALAGAGKIRHWGVSNLDTDDLRELDTVPHAGQLQTDQLLYNLSRRGIEYDLLPMLAERNVPVMAYSPIEQGRLLAHAELRRIAAEHPVGENAAVAAQIALAWLLRRPDVIAIPKASSVEHIRQNHAAQDIELSGEELAALDAAFPPPVQAEPLEML
ncbi:aldo/keto reductase [Paenarthrobacter sp. PH39-S1]|uniref:aldo/keto reductase n=1 Tax=Paenarthrobacter sp. PH39-S1 TaxID=3046204 RepID=UPI0024B8B3E7|nr:aldo/keto reductase [Paenarthrobacter sp. PH39-S1]MDJ0357174.1 aldo/keto reductase [Paenarthrobacter sp. PH39-S1]